MKNTTKTTKTTTNCDICIITDTITPSTHICNTCHFNVCADCAADNYTLDHARIDAHQNCKHGMDIYNCYDGCYDEMKNGTVN